MNDAIGVKVGESQGNVMAEIHLSVLGEWFIGLLQELGQTLIH